MARFYTQEQKDKKIETAQKQIKAAQDAVEKAQSTLELKAADLERYEWQLKMAEGMPVVGAERGARLAELMEARKYGPRNGAVEPDVNPFISGEVTDAPAPKRGKVKTDA